MKVAVVTGTSYGLGKSIAVMLLNSGYKVYGISRTESKFNNKDFVWIKADLSQDDDLKIILDSILEDNIDLLVNNAGIIDTQSSLEFTDKVFNNVFRINFIAPIKLTSILLNKLSSGVVINISSTSDRIPEKTLALYCSSKTALDMYFSVAALEYKNIKFINILPDYVDTPLLRKYIKDESFDWSAPLKTNKFADGFKFIVENQIKFNSGSRVIILPGSDFLDANYPEDVWVVNVDTKEFKKLKY